MVACTLENALIPGNIVEVTAKDKIKMGVILSNNQIAYFKNSGGFDTVDGLLWRNNNDEDDYYISRVYTPGYGFSFEFEWHNLKCIYSKYPKYPCEVPDDVEYEMVYDGRTFICKNMNLFGEDVVAYRVDGVGRIVVERVTEFENDLVLELTIGEEGEE